MRRSRWIVLALAALNGGWMAFDGARALVVGDYVTPSSGDHAGRLGPWADVVRAAGLEPRSTFVELAFVVYGVALAALAAAYARGAARARTPLLVVAALGLWYLPFGTLVNLVVIALVLRAGTRSGRSPRSAMIPSWPTTGPACGRSRRPTELSAGTASSTCSSPCGTRACSETRLRRPATPPPELPTWSMHTPTPAGGDGRRPDADGSPMPDPPRVPRRRWLLFGALLLSWPVMLARAWAAFWTLPSAELLERQRMVRPPTMASLRWEVLQSAAELAVLALLLWPRWRRFYLLRLLVAGLGTLLWFVLTTPLAITSVQRVHRTWLALAGAALVLLAVIGIAWAAATWLRARLAARR